MEDVALHNESSLKALVRAIRFSQGQFRLILARCNYGALRDAIVQRLRELSSVEIRELVLPESVKSLYSAIKDELRDEVPPVLMVFGLESMSDIKGVLTSSNYIREEFKENFPFPLVLWINDDVLQKLLRIAPDLESWATSVEFSLTTEELIDFLRQKVDQLFTDDAIITLKDYSELEAACKELQSRGQGLEPDLEASLEFVRGLDDFANDRIDTALEHYQSSLTFLGQERNYLIRQGILLLGIALCYYRKAEIQRSHSRRYWEQSRDYLQRCLSVFALAQRPDLVGKYGSQLAEVLRCLQAWEELKSLIPKIGKLHQRYGKTNQIAQDYGFLAEVALEEKHWQEAYQFAQKALQILAKVPESQINERGLYRFLLARSQQHLEQIPEAIENLEQAREESNSPDKPQLYIDILENLRSLYFQQGEYLKAFQVKQEKRSIEYQYGIHAFAGASHLQPKRQVINPKLAQTERQAIVAQEIAASGREPFVKRLIERISGNHHKLTVIHGQSGVGKSSIIQAGLVPALKQQAIGERDALPVVLRVYTDWVGMLGRCLVEALREIQIERNRDRGAVRLLTSHLAKAFREVGKLPSIDSSQLPGSIPPPPPLKRGEPEEIAPYSSQEKPEESSGASPPFEAGALVRRLGGSFFSTDTIIKQLRLNADCNLLTVLIFDQFEEFFFVSKEPAKRRQFYEFLGICLNIPFVKVILSLREDYLHYLLECNRLNHLDAINHNILDKDILCYLGNFSPEEAKVIIESLTNRSQFYLKPALIDELVKDLAVEFDSVRPIELQVVGAQLQENQITTLEKYRQLGDNPKAALVKQYLEGVIQDCGKENERIARLVLYWLTDENLTRPLKTRTELVKDLAAADLKAKANILDIVLPILVGSGLVVRVPESPDDRYQLVHDYLVAFIRQQQGAEVEELRKEVEFQRRRAEELQILGQSDALIRYSEALFNQGKNLEALIEGLRAGIPLKQVGGAKGDIWIRVVTTLRQEVYGVLERNRLEKHNAAVNSISFSPDGKTIASASSDKTIKLWSCEGNLIHTLQGHNAAVNSISFSPDGKTIASVSSDGTINLWSCEGNLIHTVQGHKATINSVSFSPDGKMIASASSDGTIKLRSCEGDPLHILKEHNHLIYSVSFSPSSKMIASASEDKTIKLWSYDGNLLHIFKGHDYGVYSVSFSPDGKIIASTSWDRTIKLWSLEGDLLHTLKGHYAAVNSVSFSPDGKMIASASWDETIKLWSREGNLIHTLKGHYAAVNSVSFSPNGKTLASGSSDGTIKLWSHLLSRLHSLKGHNAEVNSVTFSPDGKTIISASKDKTIKLWSLEGNLLHTFQGHSEVVYSVSFSPDGKMIASTSWDKTVKLWSLEGKLLYTIKGHDHAVYSVSFSPDGKTIASASRDKTIKLWSLKGNCLHILRGHDDRVNSISFSPDGKMLASASYDKTVKIWNTEGKLLHTLKGHDHVVYSVSFSPDGKIVASASRDKTIKLWDREGNLIYTLHGHRAGVNSISFSPDGKTIASASWDKSIKLWNREGNLLHTLEGHDDAVYSVSYSPDGKTIASASEDRTVILWNLDLDDLLVRGCNWVRNYLKSNPNVKESDRHLCDDILAQK